MAKMVRPIQAATSGFAGEWQAYDDSPHIKEWLTFISTITRDVITLVDTSGRRATAKGEITGNTAMVNFPDDRTYKAELIDDNTIQWDGDSKNRWIRKGSSEDPNFIFENTLKTGSAADVLGIVKTLQDAGEGWRLRILVEEWVGWIASGDPTKIRLIEETADNMRSNADVVRYLVIQLGQQAQPDQTSSKVNGGSGALEDAHAKTLKIHRRIARLMAEMSDIKYFENDQEKFPEVKKALIDYAISALVPRLPIEEDLEIRRDFAVTLGKLGENETVDALVRAVVSDEQVRASRQHLLADYYLEPSKKQSEQAAGILQDAVMEAKKTLWMLQWLNGVVFITGMIILLGGLYFSLAVDNARVAGALVGIGGFAGVIGLLINDPLNRIQNSMSNLVQLETAFTSFIWELNLNSTFIQSQYVAEGLLRDEDVAQTLKRMEDAMDFAMNQVATYTDEGRELVVPHLTHLSPMVGQASDSVHVYGNHLKASGGSKNAPSQMTVAINHIPALTVDRPEKKEEIEFELPANGFARPNSPGEILWISLIIKGTETNALPLRLMAETEPAQGEQPALPPGKG